jgi:hypothetical protein
MNGQLDTLSHLVANCALMPRERVGLVLSGQPCLQLLRHASTHDGCCQVFEVLCDPDRLVKQIETPKTSEAVPATSSGSRMPLSFAYGFSAITNPQI